MRRGVSPAISFVFVLLIVMTAAIMLYFWFGGNPYTPAIEYVSVTVSAYPYNSTMIMIVNAEARNSSSYTHLNTSAGRCDFDDAADCDDTLILRPGVPTPCYLRTDDCTANVVGSGRVAIYGEGINTVYVRL